MKKSNFMSMLFRMKYINRWSLMRNTEKENLKEHSFDTAAIAHALMVIGKKRFGKEYDEKAVVLSALYHDVGETLTGDMPTPVKYYNPEIKKVYKDIERISEDKILSLLPDDFKDEYECLLRPEDESVKLICKAADRISAVIKCREEIEAGNKEFEDAYKSQIDSLKKMNIPEADMFMELYLDSFFKTLDKIQG